MASPGYGKRTAPGQRARSRDDFRGLPRREAEIAAFIDRLPEGADISVKMLAKVMNYGQCALSTALTRIQRAGHLRRGREQFVGPDGARWVTRTYFSRTAREDAWWEAFTAGEVKQDEGRSVSSDPPVIAEATAIAVAAAPAEDAPTVAAVPPEAVGVELSPAYLVLASVGRAHPAMGLSAQECVDLEPLAAEWLRRGASQEQVLCALTSGLPATGVARPGSFARSRLTRRLPPEIAPPSDGDVPESGAGRERMALRILECSRCGTPRSAAALSGGECPACRGLHPVPPALAPEDVSRYAADIRARTREAGPGVQH
ncbi:hypothetical protein [Streptomyces montanisoli]|nr:hypothetical protein [Streptomyces montanisoli]